MSRSCPCRPWFVLLVLACLFLANCTRQGLLSDQKKIGMHIDAVLEFVIEYPLDWQKDRRVIYGTSNGEVRWSHQTHSGDVMLRVISKKNTIPANISENQLSEQFLDYPDLKIETIVKREHIQGDFWHFTGFTEKSRLDGYLFTNATRLYRIIFLRPQDSHDNYSDILERIGDSFAPLASQE